MANINSYLEAIMNAVYGEEVRGSIHDAISAINDESADAKSAAITAQDSAKNSATVATNYAEIATSAKTAAESAKTAAEKAKTTAESAKASAETAQKKAAASESNASTSATNAAASESNAKSAEQSIDSKVEDVMGIKNNLIKYHSIYLTLNDSANDTILDSSGNAITGQVIYPDMEDVIKLQKSVEALSDIFDYLNNQLLNSRVEQLESSTVKTEQLEEIIARVTAIEEVIPTIRQDITKLTDSALLDNNFKEEIQNGYVN